jgi:alpha-glucosidase
MSEPWWRGSVLYQIYPRSYLDTNGDGVGDLVGIIDRLDYIAKLGVAGIWISPFFKSPMDDFGYDVADYRQVDRIFGSDADFDRLLSEAHRRGLKIIIDMVLAHCSIQHAWFEESRQSLDNPKADWFVWADPRDDGTAPNNWLASFGGISWSWEPRRQQYYLHNFLPSMPQLNHHNPELVDAVMAECTYWLDKGVDGFRLDVANYYTYDRKLRDNPPAPHDPNQAGLALGNPAARQLHIHDRSQPDTLPILRRLRALSERYTDRFLMAEIHDLHWDRLISEYTGPGLLHSAYGLTVVRSPSIGQLRSLVEQLENRGDAWPSWAFSNHDAQRVATRWSNGDASPMFARQMLALLLTLRGTPIIYQGEELGLPEADIPFERIVDPPGKAFWPVNKGRDGARSPIPWNNDHPHAGFSAVEPWLPVDPRHLPLAANIQEEENESTLAFTRQFIKWRSNHPALLYGDSRFVDIADNVLAIERRLGEKAILALFNLGPAMISVQPPRGYTMLEGYPLPATFDASGVTLHRYGAAYLEGR